MALGRHCWGALERIGSLCHLTASRLLFPGDDALPNGLDVTFEVTELRRLTGSYNTMVGNNEGSMVRPYRSLWHSIQAPPLSSLPS